MTKKKIKKGQSRKARLFEMKDLRTLTVGEEGIIYMNKNGRRFTGEEFEKTLTPKQKKQRAKNKRARKARRAQRV